jgi:hypothetical protein
MIYHVACKYGSGPLLWFGDDRRFRIIQYNELTPLITGPGYTLITPKYLPAFEGLLQEEVEIIPASIYRLATHEEWNDYFQLLIHKTIRPKMIDRIQSTHENIWQYEGYLFVAQRIKDKLAKLSTGELQFSPGFSHFG